MRVPRMPGLLSLARLGFRKRRTNALVVFVLVLVALYVLPLPSLQRQNPVFNARWDHDETAGCDISSSSANCIPDSNAVNLIFPVDFDPLHLVSGVNYPIRVQLRTTTGTPIFASDSAFGEGQGVKILAARVDGVNEVFLLEDPKTVRWGTWEFTFHVKTSGAFTLSIYFQGARLWWPESPSTSANWPSHAFLDADAQLEFALVQEYELNADYPGTESQLQQGAAHLLKLPVCSPEEMHNMKGRWINPTSMSKYLPLDFFNKFVPPTSPKGSSHFFVGDSCLIRYVGGEEARHCFANQDISFVGDSTVEEYFLDFAMHLDAKDDSSEASDLLPPTWPSTWGASKTCKVGHAHPRLSLWKLPAINSTISFSWLGHWNLCENLKGITTLDHQYGLYRILSGLADPEAIMTLSADFEEGPLIKFPTPPRSRIDKSRTSTVVYGTGLHDLYTLKSGEINLEDYVKKMGDAAKLFAPYATKGYLLPSLPVLDHNNEVIKLMNEQAAEKARDAGFGVLPHYWLKNQRPFVDKDWHHASRLIVTHLRTPELHVGTQAFLNVACPSRLARR